MNSQNQTPRKPTINLKFKNPTIPMDQTESDYSDDEVGQEYLQFGSQYDNNNNNISLKKKKIVTNSHDDEPLSCCQVDGCSADLTAAKRYHRRHKVCEVHAKAPVVVVSGLLQRFCQQCSRFHDVSEFDNARRSCRNRLADHNERRRKSSSEATQVVIGKGRSRHESSSDQVGERSSTRSNGSPW